MFEALLDFVFFFGVVMAFAAVHRIYGWRGSAIALAPVLLMFCLGWADQVGWLNLYDASKMVSAACWWFGLGAAGTVIGAVMMKIDGPFR